jgi:hypothetical protein
VSSSPARRRRIRRAGASLAATAVFAATAVLAAAAAPSAALATVVPIAGAFGLIPTPTPGGQPRPYFQPTVAPGHSAHEIAVVSNESSRTERLKITTSRAVTATDSGSAFEPNTRRWCSGPGCWVKGLPITITLAPGAKKGLGFTVTVPRFTRPGQYLAGLTAESAVRPKPIAVGSNGRASARAIIIDQVTVGVAVTVGRLSRLHTVLTIWRVSAGWVGTTPRLYIPVANLGQTFVRATGDVSCRSGGGQRTYPVVMATVLPGGRAVLPVNARGLRAGPAWCTVRLRTSAGATVTWSGSVNVPPETVTRTYHPAKGVYVSLPESTIPSWAVALMVIGVLILASLAALVIQHRRQQRRPARVARKAVLTPGGARRRTAISGLARKRTAT